MLQRFYEPSILAAVYPIYSRRRADRGDVCNCTATINRHACTKPLNEELFDAYVEQMRAFEHDLQHNNVHVIKVGLICPKSLQTFRSN